MALVERLGNETNVSVNPPGGMPLMAVLDGDRALRLGENIVLGFDPDHALLFDRAGVAR
ncbi:TOBE domain-containing protein [Devosia submarina]|uniref:TOBE domain-containing protein n=1 Tax=Devosia submarina TaxID=1173082 RepID=UPI001FE32007